MFLHLNTGAGTEGLKSRRLRVKFFLDKPECRVRGFKEQEQKLSADCINGPKTSSKAGLHSEH